MVTIVNEGNPLQGSIAPKDKHPRYKHLAEFDLKEVLALRKFGKSRALCEVNGETYKVKVSSLRLHVFAESCECVCCGIKGTRMVLDKQLADTFESPHFNLYGESDGELILMTKDHRTPKAQGGSNKLDNFQTMCTRCNGAKDDKIISIEELRKTFEVRQYLKG